MRHSHAARTQIEILVGTNPKVRISMVRVARSAAGLKPGKNFKTPNQKKTTPRLMRKSTIA
jgi:hypothetical protein